MVIVSLVERVASHANGFARKSLLCQTKNGMDLGVGAAASTGEIFSTRTIIVQDEKKYSGLQALLMSLMVILVSEIGDKTFLIAAVMAMQHPRLLIFSAAIAALLVMTVLSALMGQVLPQLISKNYSEIAAAVLFFIFVRHISYSGVQTWD